MSRWALSSSLGLWMHGVVWAQEPALDPALVEDVLEHRSGVLDCYADTLGLDPYAAGHARVTVMIGRYGKVVDAVVEEQCVSGERFRRCVERKLKQVAFEPNTPRTTVTHELLFNSGLIGHVIRGGSADIDLCAKSAPPPPGGHFTMSWQVRNGEIIGAKVVDQTFDASALSQCLGVRSEHWAWDFSKHTDGDVRYAFRFVEARDEPEPLVAPGAATPAPAADEGPSWWGELRSGADLVAGNREVATIPIAVSGGERWGQNELFGEATGQTTERWHAHVRYHRWVSDRSALHLLVGARDDRFAGYERRDQLLVGYSGWLVENEGFTMALDLGVELAVEDYVRSVNKDWRGLLGARFALPLAWRLHDRFAVYSTIVAYQTLGDSEDRRLHNGLGLRVLVARPLSVEIGHNLAYDRDPVRGKEALDHAITLGATLTLGELPAVRWFDPLP